MKCLIIDDDPLICDLIEHYCRKTDLITSVTITYSGFESLNLINANSFDLIFLDYDLPDITGKEILNIIDKNTLVIMITSHSEFAGESYAYEQILDFLIKPVKFPRFLKAVQKVSKSREKNSKVTNAIFLKDGNKLVKVDFEKILFFKSEANYISVNMNESKFLTLMTIKELEKKIPESFMRIHRSFIINLEKIEEIDQHEVKIGKYRIPVSDSYAKDLLKRINLLN